MDTQVLTQADLDALEAQRAELDEQIDAVKRSLHGPIPNGASWGEDREGPILYLSTGPDIEWNNGAVVIDEALEDDYGVTLECLETFCQRTRAWREAQT